MAEQVKSETKANAAAGALPTIRFETGNMKSSYANVVNVSSTREEFTLLFGTNQSWHAGQKELVVDLTDRVILNPHAAKRLLHLITRVVGEYETNFGELFVEGEKKSKKG